MKKRVSPGIYQHYKGGEYEVIGVAKHSETLDDLVVYRHPGNELSELWVRPLSMFTETVTVAGADVQRFTRID